MDWDCRIIWNRPNASAAIPYRIFDNSSFDDNTIILPTHLATGTHLETYANVSLFIIFLLGYKVPINNTFLVIFCVTFLIFGNFSVFGNFLLSLLAIFLIFFFLF